MVSIDAGTHEPVVCPAPPVEQSLVLHRELACWLLLIALADVTIYRGHGMAGLALLFAISPLLIYFGHTDRKPLASVWLVSAMVALLVARLLWLGSALAVTMGFVLLISFALTLQGVSASLANTVDALGSLAFGGFARFRAYLRSLPVAPLRMTSATALSIALPAAIVALFSLLFVFANPDLVTRVIELLRQLEELVVRFIERFSEYLTEALFCLAAAWFASGFLRHRASRNATSSATSAPASGVLPVAGPAWLYPATRNALVAVIVLFAIYLTFEFVTLWFRTFPPGFHYSGYAHQGAAWLTIALATATLVLSLLFQGPILHDARIQRLRRLAWIWWFQNLLLALAVYHRMFIYIDFNGMTRMRTIGLFGITTVVVGFVLVLRKVSGDRSFGWLLRNQLRALALAIFLYAITPVDALVHRYNVARIAAGDSSPAVQISVHPLNAEGVMQLFPLLECRDQTVREGVTALLAQRAIDLENQPTPAHWSAFQASEQLLRNQLQQHHASWQTFRDPQLRSQALERFHAYAYQWY